MIEIAGFLCGHKADFCVFWGCCIPVYLMAGSMGLLWKQTQHWLGGWEWWTTIAGSDGWIGDEIGCQDEI